jgi:hypothetical protein
VKYSFQYGVFDGETVFQHDNSPDHPGAPHHHKHERGGSVVGIEFDGVAALYQR